MHSNHHLVESDDKKPHVQGRKKLWELDSPLHCSIIGTCLSLAELRRLCQKLQIRTKTRLSDHELHRSFVHVAARPTYASRRLHKYLDQKYRSGIRIFTRLHDAASLERRWDDAVESGDIASAYWALVTHPDAPEALMDRVYGEVHMLSHLAGATVRVDMQELDRQQRLTRTLNRQLVQMQAQNRAQSQQKDQTIQQLEKQLRQSENECQELDLIRQRLKAMENHPPLMQLEKHIEDITARLAAEQARAESAETQANTWKRMAIESGDRHLQLESRLAELQTEQEALEASLTRLLDPDCNSCTSQDGCAGDINLCGRCVLYVGGRSRQCVHFRALVERQNGHFMHHDGGLHGGRTRLGAILPQADVVICPLDCVSHDAAKRVKQYCKRHGKRLVFLHRSSLAAFARGLNELAA